MQGIIVFIIAQVLTVITSTIKSIATVKSTPTVAGIINAVAYTINALVVKLITEQDMYVVLIITFLSNIIGVPLGKMIMDKLEKERLWVYVATINCNHNFIQEHKENLSQHDLPCIYQEIIEDKLYELKVYSSTKYDSTIIKGEFDNIGKLNVKIKYHIIEPL